MAFSPCTPFSFPLVAGWFHFWRLVPRIDWALKSVETSLHTVMWGGIYGYYSIFKFILVSNPIAKRAEEAPHTIKVSKLGLHQTVNNSPISQSCSCGILPGAASFIFKHRFSPSTSVSPGRSCSPGLCCVQASWAGLPSFHTTQSSRECPYVQFEKRISDLHHENVCMSMIMDDQDCFDTSSHSLLAVFCLQSSQSGGYWGIFFHLRLFDSEGISW